MRSLLEEIRAINKDAARALERAGCFTDPVIKSLSRTDLNELLPGADKLHVRKTVYDKIQNTKAPIEVILQELKSFVPDEVFRGALTGEGPAVKYLEILKELKGYVTQFQTFIDAHINLLEGKEGTQVQEQTNVKNPRASSGGTGLETTPSTSSAGHLQRIQETGIQDKPHQTSGNVQTYTLVTVMNKTIITGKTLNADQQVLDKVKKNFVLNNDSFQLKLEEMEDVKICKVIIVFCPVVSRVGTDVESAMSHVPDGKDVILVLMHHTREAKTSWSLRTWTRPKNVVLDINVFFHDAIGGLLSCRENDDAVFEIQRKLLGYSSHTETRPVVQNPPTRSFSGIFDSFFSK